MKGTLFLGWLVGSGGSTSSSGGLTTLECADARDGALCGHAGACGRLGDAWYHWRAAN